MQIHTHKFFYNIFFKNIHIIYNYILIYIYIIYSNYNKTLTKLAIIKYQENFSNAKFLVLISTLDFSYIF